MQFQKNAKGFTLIELLVVITIIGILAVGGVTVYTSQIQKARDTTRIQDVEALQGGIEQVFSDAGVYPEVGVSSSGATVCTQADPTHTSVACVVSLGFMNSLPKDPKSSQGGNGSPLDYTYTDGPKGSVTQQVYEVSTGLENAGNVASKAAVDNGNDANRFEVGTDLTLNTGITSGGAQATGTSGSYAIAAGTASCSGFGGNSASTAAAQGNVILVRGNCP